MDAKAIEALSSLLLTQDETPSDYRPTEFPEPNDPDIILRGQP